MSLALRSEMTPAQSQEMSRTQMMLGRYHHQLELWESDPQSQLPDGQISKGIYLNNRSGGFDVGDFWKREVREQLLNLPQRESVTVGITSTGSGAGKGSIAEGLMYFAENDLYLLNEAVNQRVSIVPVVVQFAMYMKAAQIPKDRGGPGLISPAAGHGKFTEEEYAIGSAFGQSLLDEHSSKNRNPHVRYLYLVEGSGVPWIKQKGRRVKVSDMPDRGASTVYNHPRSRKSAKFVLVVDRNKQVSDEAIGVRGGFDPEAQDFSHVFNNGTDRYFLTNRQGQVRDVSQMAFSVQRAVIDLKRLATAPVPAIERSDGEYSKMKDILVRKKIISDPSDISYLQALRERLVYEGGYTEEQVLFVDNPHRESSQLREHNLDYFLRRNLVARLYPQLLPARLRGTYMDLYPTSNAFK